MTLAAILPIDGLALPAVTDARVQVHRTADWVVRIGQHGDATDASLLDVLHAAASIDHGQAWARAWQLLLAFDCRDQQALALFLAEAWRAENDWGGSLQVLLVRIAQHAPRAVARLVVDLARPETMLACGEEALPAVMHELASGSPLRRQSAAHSLDVLVRNGILPSLEDVRAALLREDDPDVRNLLRPIVEALQHPAAAPRRRSVDLLGAEVWIAEPVRPGGIEVRRHGAEPIDADGCSEAAAGAAGEARP